MENLFKNTVFSIIAREHVLQYTGGWEAERRDEEPVHLAILDELGFF